jgi:hypothetical protein
MLIVPELQRLIAKGAGPIEDLCVVDVGGIGRWISECQCATSATNTWQRLVDATQRSHRSFVWVAALPGDVPNVFDSIKLDESVESLRALGIRAIIRSDEPVTSLLSHDSTVVPHAATTVVTAMVSAYPEQLFVLEGSIQSMLDIATGATHTYWSQFRDGLGEPLFIPLIQAAVRGNPVDPKRRPLAGRRAEKFLDELDRLIQDIPMPDGSQPSVYSEVLDRWWANLEKIEARAKAIVGSRLDSVARASLQGTLRARRSPTTSPSATPIVVVPFETGVNGKIERGRASPTVVRGNNTETCLPHDGRTAYFLSNLVKIHPKVWIAPRALDLLGFMVDHGIPLPERVVDPAHCAFALNPDALAEAVSACPGARDIPGDAASWLWDVKRKERPPNDLAGVAVVLSRVVTELKSQVKKRGMQSLVEDDIAATVPVLASMERRGAWLAGAEQLSNAWHSAQMEMNRLERAFSGFLGCEDPYQAHAAWLVSAAGRKGISVPPDRVHAGEDARNTLARLALVDSRIEALVQARTLAEILEWLERVGRSGERFRGHHFPEVSGRWGMNAWHLQGMPKHSLHAKLVRALLQPPPGKLLLAADFSSFELRLVAGLSGDPMLTLAAQQADAIGHLAESFFGTTNDPVERARRRAMMKSHIHPINYGSEEWGFVQAQTSMPVAEAKACYEVLRGSFSRLFEWRDSMLNQTTARTLGGWERTPPVRSRRALENKVVSTTVQGLAADILRWCLRELHRTLPAIGAELIFQNHDEIYVAADKKNINVVRSQILDVLETRVVRHSGLVPAGIKLVARVKEGVTWANVA